MTELEQRERIRHWRSDAIVHRPAPRAGPELAIRLNGTDLYFRGGPTIHWVDREHAETYGSRLLAQSQAALLTYDVQVVPV